MSGKTGNMITWRRATALTLVLAMSAGCTPMNRFHGFTPTDAELASVQVGQSTRESVIESFGPPTTNAVFENDALFYVSSQFRHFGALAPEEVSREILAISFTPEGVVRNIERFTLEDGRVVSLDRRVTDDGINDVTVLSQLLGSLGRIDAGTLLGESPDDI
ncbi:outer membrane protein assembly factor BamE [Yoonia sp. 2307UL14-13]|uniref:outer membrane protein assembly factor BamE n=1 Tax=Yoonia sp. 2307UL14-13 TaxID=3126506 RepID=UPI0030981F04